MPLYNGGRIGSNNKPFTGTKSDDPNYSNVSLLLNGNGTNGSTTFTDSSSYGHTVTPVGNAQISTTQSKFGGSSMYFDGSGDHLEVAASSVFDLDYGSFTVEAWIYLTANGTTAANETYWPIVNKHSIYNTLTTNNNSTAWDFRYSPQLGNKLTFVNRISASNFTEGTNLFSINSTAINLSLNTWYHVAAVRNGTTLKLFLDGQDVTDTNTGNYDWSTINLGLDTGAIGGNKLRVGRVLGGSDPGTVQWYAVGYIDDLRITKGVARYTSNFTPPTAELPGAETGTFASGLWTLEEQSVAIRKELWPGFTIPIVTDGLVLNLDAGDSNSYPGSGTTWTDLSGQGNNGTINGATYSSNNGGYFDFDGTNDEVLINNNTIARIGTGNHTITAWVNNDIVTEEDFIGTNGTSQGDVLLMIFSAAAGGQGGFRGHVWSSTGSSNVIDSPRAIGTGNWSMLTQRVTWGGNIDLFENGVLTATQALVGSAPTSSRTQMVIGCRVSGGDSSHFDGKISKVSIYNKALTAAEIQQNFNALKGRYGL